MIQKYEVNTSKLTFEITESTYVNNTEAVNQVIHNFQRQNIHISMDDFGSGYSSLNTLKDLRFDEVKIDRKVSWGFPERKCKDCTSGNLSYAEAHEKINRM